MICPHCGYEHGWKYGVSVKGEEGSFYDLPVKLERFESLFDTEQTRLFACPACKKTFVE